MQLGKQLQRLQRRLSRSSADLGSAGVYDSPTSSAAAAAADMLKPGPDGSAAIQAQQQAVAAADEDGPFAGVQQHPPPGAYVARAYAGGQGAGGPDYGQVPARGWYLHGCVIMAALGVRWWLLNQTDPLQRKVMLVIIWPVSAVGQPLGRGLFCLCVWRGGCSASLLLLLLAGDQQAWEGGLCIQHGRAQLPVHEGSVSWGSELLQHRAMRAHVES